MIKAVIFDIDDTLYDFRNANVAAITAVADYAEKELGIGAEEFRELHKKTMADAKQRMGDVAASHNRLIRYQTILESRGLPLHPHALRMYEIYWRSILDTAKPFAGVREMMEELHSRGIRIGIGTDMTAYIQFRKLERMELLAFVDFLVSSEEASAEKPAPVFFARCVEKALCSAEECLFVGDNLKKDVRGAMHAGLHAAWYRPQGMDPEEDVPQITDFSEIFGLL
ncbi:MAG: HAD-IA family hydrolase [Lachnospiraceae bacterium]|nr:HAD-IA family hydrolase [Lachnospiraceae bacterium]